MQDFAPETCHNQVLASQDRILGFVPGCNFPAWRSRIIAKLNDLIGLRPERVPLNIQIQSETETDQFLEKRFIFTVEEKADVPAHLLIPKTGSAPFPVVICLQGHSSGMHVSLGRTKHPGDKASMNSELDFAVQAVREGYAALVIEQRCFGERKDIREPVNRYLNDNCHHAAMNALLLGRTLIGERVWDVSRAIDGLGNFPEIDTRRIGIMGHSGGGMTAFFAACLEPRISIAMPSGYICSYIWSITQIDHCACNYIPGLLNYFDISDLAGAIAPRPLVVVAGYEDPIFPFEGVQAAFSAIQEIYEAAGATDNCRLEVGENGHRFYASLAWPAFRELSGW